ncbi:hypothetical protein [Streptomyces pinistramenti]|uniref:hypothetical protein n=1 Tax=Streptomyces pinistramenti TaxID=2884812 RepID=UPI001D097522|nr:hypothetical protein [Streptomyces pinistramenti]MCB5911378.1 hypothetical protein [Streptomyces pinistramenti]
MQRKSFVPGAALVAAAALAVGLTGCSGGSAAGGGSNDAKGGAATSSQVAEPGRYQTLPDACRLPARSTVRGMLPGDGQHLSAAEAGKLYAGQADVTYNTDRRVGCHWKRETTAGTRHLTLDIQRVVSYDSAVSDADRAQEIYTKKELAAGIPADGETPSAAPSPSESAPKGGGKGKAGKGAGKDAEANAAPQDGKAATDPTGSPSATASPSPSGASGTPDASTASRALDDLGDDAFLDDALATADSGVHRDITVVFRTSNVIVTVTYDQWSTDKTRVPGSQELQDKAHALATELADTLSE